MHSTAQFSTAAYRMAPLGACSAVQYCCLHLFWFSRAFDKSVTLMHDPRFAYTTAILVKIMGNVFSISKP